MKVMPNSIRCSRFWILIVVILGFVAVCLLKPTEYSTRVHDESRAYSDSYETRQAVKGYLRENGLSGTIGDVDEYVRKHSIQSFALITYHMLH